MAKKAKMMVPSPKAKASMLWEASRRATATMVLLISGMKAMAKVSGRWWDGRAQKPRLAPNNLSDKSLYNPQ